MTLSQLGLTPISAEKPSGDDIRYDAEFDALQAQIDKLSMTGADGEPIDWGRVAELATSILTEKSKNITVAAYLAVALQETLGVEGLIAGAELLRDLSKAFWESMYPPLKRMRGRINAYDWWNERATAFLKAYQDAAPLDPSLVTAGKTAVVELDAFMSEKSADAPVLRELSGLIERLPVAAPKQQATTDTESAREAVSEPPEASSPKQPTTPPPVPVQQTPATPPSSSSTISPATPLDDKDAQALLRQGLDLLASYRDWLFANDQTNALGYRVNRWCAWQQAHALPPSEGGATRLPPPDAQILPALAKLVAQGAWDKALRGAESRVPQHLFWLDLSFVSARALEGLGASHAAARRAVEAETLLFAERLSGIENLSFSDGTPFVGEDTRAWLESLRHAGNGNGAQADDPVGAAAAEAIRRAAGGDPVGALEALERSLAADSPARERFRLRSAMLEIIGRAGNPILVMSVAQDLVRTVDEHKLEQWEPDLALQALRSAYRALVGAKDPITEDFSRTLFARIGRINPAEALRMASKAA